jgi:Uma2 family endonuclease
LPWALANEHPSEWVDGEIIEVMTANVRHQRLLRLLLGLIGEVVDEWQLGEVTFDVLMRLIDRPSGRVPDIMFISTKNQHRLHDAVLEGPADLVVEIVSPDSEIRDRRDKVAEYEAAGIPEYWLIDEPRREALFYVLAADRTYHEISPRADGIYMSTILPELRIRVDWLWRDPLPTLKQALADL